MISNTEKPKDIKNRSWSMVIDSSKMSRLVVIMSTFKGRAGGNRTREGGRPVEKAAATDDCHLTAGGLYISARGHRPQWRPSLQRYYTENSKYIFQEKELRGHSPNSHIHVSVCDLFIPRIGLPILLQENRRTDRL
jgi:hypothetical protein